MFEAKVTIENSCGLMEPDEKVMDGAGGLSVTDVQKQWVTETRSVLRVLVPWTELQFFLSCVTIPVCLGP